MEIWEQEIETIQRNLSLSARHVLLIDSPLTEMLSYAITLFGEYHPVSVTCEQAIQWLRERECQQTLPSIFLLDCSYESDELDRFLVQFRASKRTLMRTPKVVLMTSHMSSLVHEHADVDGVLIKPFKIRVLRAHIL